MSATPHSCAAQKTVELGTEGGGTAGGANGGNGGGCGLGGGLGCGARGGFGGWLGGSLGAGDAGLGVAGGGAGGSGADGGSNGGGGCTGGGGEGDESRMQQPVQLQPSRVSSCTQVMSSTVYVQKPHDNGATHSFPHSGARGSGGGGGEGGASGGGAAGSTGASGGDGGIDGAVQRSRTTSVRLMVAFQGVVILLMLSTSKLPTLSIVIRSCDVRAKNPSMVR